MADDLLRWADRDAGNLLLKEMAALAREHPDCPGARQKCWPSPVGCRGRPTPLCHAKPHRCGETAGLQTTRCLEQNLLDSPEIWWPGQEMYSTLWLKKNRKRNRRATVAAVPRPNTDESLLPYRFFQRHPLLGQHRRGSEHSPGFPRGRQQPVPRTTTSSWLRMAPPFRLTAGRPYPSRLALSHFVGLSSWLRSHSLSSEQTSYDNPDYWWTFDLRDSSRPTPATPPRLPSPTSHLLPSPALHLSLSTPGGLGPATRPWSPRHSPNRRISMESQCKSLPRADPSSPGLDDYRPIG